MAARTGLEASTLRMWEQRHGFPVPDRLPSGHRRYSEDDVGRILTVVRDREAGLELRAAIEKAKRGARDGALGIEDSSIYAGLRHARPDLRPYLLSKGVLMQISHAIEDECGSGAHPALLMASFQRERFYRHAQARWLDLAAAAETAVVLADFAEVYRPEHGPIEVPIGQAEPIGREWALICDSPDFTALLAGWELPGQDHVKDLERTFETVWSVEPELVRAAARVAGVIVERSAPGAVPGLAERLEAPVEPGPPAIGLLVGLANRMVAYVGGATTLPARRSSASG
jgi:DICT domain-containing protein